MSDQLNKQKILSNINITLDDLIIAETIGSTNDALYDLIKKTPKKRIAFLSEEQTAGKGRQGKTWYSPKYQHIYCSLSWHTQKPLIEIQGLSMGIGRALLTLFKAMGLDNKLFLKHPNDILYDNKKLLGILIETFSPTPNETTVIIGIGCNVHTPADHTHAINQPWITLDQITQSVNDRNPLAAAIINTTYQFLDKLQNHCIDYTKLDKF